MTRIETTATVTPDGRMTVDVPEVRLEPGQHHVVIEVDAQRCGRRTPPEPFDFPVIHVGAWPEGLSLRREDMYGDDGR